MDPVTYITWQMKQESNAVGFIPRATVQNRYIARGCYLLQRNSLNEPIGYLLHGRPKRGWPLHVHQVAIRIDHRRRLNATRLLRTLEGRAVHDGATCITLRCALDLEANQFWLASGFRLISTTPGGSGRHRQIATYRLDLPTPTLSIGVSNAWDAL